LERLTSHRRLTRHLECELSRTRPSAVRSRALPVDQITEVRVLDPHFYS
jgi:hypothetical protein